MHNNNNNNTSHESADGRCDGGEEASPLVTPVG